MRKPRLYLYLTRCDTNGAVQPKKMARGLKFRIKEEEGLYYLCDYRAANLHLYAQNRFSQDAGAKIPIGSNEVFA